MNDSDMPRLLWNYLRVDIAADHVVRLGMIGPGGLTRQQALDDVQHYLDDLAEHAPTARWRELFRASAEDWRGGVPDDTIRVGHLGWAVYMHFDTVDPAQAALAWCEDLAERISHATGSAIAVDLASTHQIRGHRANSIGSLLRRLIARLVRR